MGNMGLILLAMLLLAGCTKEARLQRAMSRANRYYQAGDFSKAEIEYLKANRLHPPQPIAIGRLGMIYADQGRQYVAFSYLRKAKELDAGLLGVRAKLARLELEFGRPDEASQDAAYVVDRQPTNELAWLTLCDTVRSTNQLLALQQKLTQARQQVGEHYVMYLAEAALLLRQGRLTNAQAALNRALSLNANSSQAFTFLATIAMAQNDLPRAEQALTKAAELAPPRSEARLRLAEFKLRRRQPEESRRLLEEMTQQTPDYIPAWMNLAKMDFARREFDASLEHVNKALTREDINLEAHLLQARINVAKQNVTNAVTLLERTRTLFPRAPIVHYELARVNLMRNDTASASENLNQAINLKTNYFEAILLQAQISLRKGEALAAVTLLNQVIRNAEQSHRPQVPEVHLLLASAQVARGLPAEAQAVYRRMAQLFPKDPRVPYAAGEFLLGQKQIAEARREFEKTLQLNPRSIEATSQLVQMDLQQKQYDVAMQRVRQCASVVTNSVFPQYLQARIYLAQGQTNPAQAVLEKVVERQPNFRLAYYDLVRILIALNQQQQALDKLNRLVEQNPKDTTPLIQTALIYDRMGEFEKAAATYEKILKINPQSGEVMNNLAYLYSERLNKLDLAYDYARKARELIPEGAATADTMGWIMYKRGDYPWALNLLQESAQEQPNDPEVHYHLGVVHYHMGEEAPAKLALQKVLQLNADFPQREQVEQYLQLLNLNPSMDRSAVAMLQKRVSEQPRDTLALIRLAEFQQRDAQYAEAAKSLEQALKVHTNAVPAMKQLVQLYLDHLGNTNRAFELARSLRAQLPNDPQTAYLLGRLAYQSGDFRRAHGLLNESVRQTAPLPEARYLLAWSAYRLGKVAEAQTNLLIALESGTNFTQASASRRFLTLLGAQQNPGDASRVLAQAQESLKADPKDLPALMVTARVQEQKGNGEGARDVYESIYKQEPGFPLVYPPLAAIYARNTNTITQAYELATKAREAFPDQPEVAKTLGQVMYQRGDYSRAVQLLRDSQRQMADDPETYYYLGLAQRQLKKDRECREALNKALSLNLNPKLAIEARRILAALSAK